MRTKQSNLLDEYKEYEVYRKGHSEFTIKTYMDSLQAFFRFKYGENKEKLSMPMFKQIKKEDIFKFKVQLQKSDKRGKTVVGRLNGLSSFLRFMKKQYNIENFNELMEELKEIRKDTTVITKEKDLLTTEEGLMVMDFAKNDFNSTFRERNYLMLVLFLNNGLRLGETLKLKESDIDIEERKIRLDPNNTKGKKSAWLPLSNREIEAYKEYLVWKRESRYSDNDYIFISRVGKSSFLCPEQGEEIISQIIKKSGINKNITPHCIRKTFATILHRNGASPYEVQRRLRHINLTTTGIYIDINEKQLVDSNKFNPFG